MRLGVDIPSGWRTMLDKAAGDAGYKSVTGYIRHLIAKDIGLTEPKDTWGGIRIKQVVQVDTLEKKQDTQVAQVEVKIEPKRVVSQNPTEIIRQRKAEAHAKFSTPASKPKETP